MSDITIVEITEDGVETIEVGFPGPQGPATSAAITTVDPAVAGGSNVQDALEGLDSLKLAKADNLSDVANAATAFGNIKQAASESATGVVELATSAETVTGTDTARATHPAGVKAAIDALIDSAPGALDTLNELAAALGDDANFATTVTNALAAKQPLSAVLTAAADDAVLGPDTPNFYHNSGATIWKVADRLFVGDQSATGDDSTQDQGSYIPTSAEGAWWLLAGSTLLAISNHAGCAITGVARSSDGPGETALGVSGVVINDAEGGHCWGLYSDIQHEDGAGGSFGLEVAAKNKGENSVWTPYGQTVGSDGGGVIGLHIVGGGDPAYGGTATNPSAMAINITGNGTVGWNTGIRFNSGALASGNGYEAIALGQNHAIKWYNSAGFAGKIHSTAATATGPQIEFGNDLLSIKDAAGNLLASFDTSADKFTILGPIEVGNASDTTLARNAAGVLEVEGIKLIRGATGGTDNALLRADGTGGSLLQATGITVDDSNNLATAGTILSTGSNITVASTTAAILVCNSNSGALQMEMRANSGAGIGFISTSTAHDLQLRRNNTAIVGISASAFYSATNDGASIGATANRFSDGFFADGAVIDLGASGSRATIAHVAASDSLTISADPDNATASSAINLATDGTNRVVIGPGVQVGAPTGGDKGAGTINAAGDIYKNDSAYTNPDYALEHYFTGKIERFAANEGAASYAGLMPLEMLEDRMREQMRLPGIGDDPMGIFARGDMALEKLEEAHLYITQLHKRIAALEKGTMLQ